MRVSCPRCRGPVRLPDLMHTDWRCDECGPVSPLHLPAQIGPEVLAAAVSEVARHHDRDARPGRYDCGRRSAAPAGDRVPLWCPWPLPTGWMVAGVGWAGDERSGIRATVLAVTGPAPLSGGPADLLLVAEAPGVGLASQYAGLVGLDPGQLLAEAMAGRPAHAKVRAGGHPTPLWSILSAEGCSAYAGEARGVWLVGIAWPATTGYLLTDDLVLQDLGDWLPAELVYAAPSARLLG